MGLPFKTENDIKSKVTYKVNSEDNLKNEDAIKNEDDIKKEGAGDFEIPLCHIPPLRSFFNPSLIVVM